MHTQQKQLRSLPILFRSRSGNRSFTESMGLFLSYLKTYVLSVLPPVVWMGVVCTLLYLSFRALPFGVAMILLLVGGIAMAFGIAWMRQCIEVSTRPVHGCLAPVKISWKKQGKSILRSCLPIFWMVLTQFAVVGILVVAAWVFMDRFPWIWIPALILWLVLVVPFNLALNVRQFGRHGFLKSWKAAFFLMRRYSGSMYLLLFMALVVFGLVAIVCCLPIAVLYMAISASDAALEVGDPSNLPSYVITLQIVLMLILLPFVFVSLLAWVLPQYFHYYSILYQEKQRRKRQRLLRQTREIYREERQTYYAAPPSFTN